jgi:hypothetical protein
MPKLILSALILRKRRFIIRYHVLLSNFILLILYSNTLIKLIVATSKNYYIAKV